MGTLKIGVMCSLLFTSTYWICADATSESVIRSRPWLLVYPLRTVYPVLMTTYHCIVFSVAI